MLVNRTVEAAEAENPILVGSFDGFLIPAADLRRMLDAGAVPVSTETMRRRVDRFNAKRDREIGQLRALIAELENR